MDEKIQLLRRDDSNETESINKQDVAYGALQGEKGEYTTIWTLQETVDNIGVGCYQIFFYSKLQELYALTIHNLFTREKLTVNYAIFDLHSMRLAGSGYSLSQRYRNDIHWGHSQSHLPNTC